MSERFYQTIHDLDTIEQFTLEVDELAARMEDSNVSEFEAFREAVRQITNKFLVEQES